MHSPFRGLLSSKKFLQLSLWHGLIQHWADSLLCGTCDTCCGNVLHTARLLITQLLWALGHSLRPYFLNNPKICFVFMYLWISGWTFPTVRDFWNLNCFSNLIAPGTNSGISFLLMGKYLSCYGSETIIFRPKLRWGNEMHITIKVSTLLHYNALGITGLNTA